ncbi:uncharacterized protein LOC122513179 [Polistes fuscatus]|uniref:uncharacterized protein LOC122513179 n=1 Tax=Polistes fuscatus TaxID=30207 RepID=UPI001CA94CF3|nr:uncharacterized protein LOC122513179 [Polistes fuscatus]
MTMRKRLVATLILPIFDYCSAAYTNISETLQTKLQRKFNACIRFIFRLQRYQHITPFRRALEWFTLQDRRDFLMACIVYKMLRLQHDKKLRTNFSILTSVRGSAIRQLDVLCLPYARTRTYDKSFLVTAVRMWNQLPEDIVDLSDYKEFRLRCYTYFIDRDIQRVL